ncbi:type I DNA topoisomerase [Candidatus Desantisbacteria bacterium CG02_land_8_20_14_3_00_49_13]|nr:MAG: DNA topoisomerase I [Candidatus Desantisbacteria bacterium CG1_02_49_89]PIV54419.1 MAG: type I DNA topoisomerase [Candidatus Desantisbacteria bacterium CG02_land_8_20_14_3_00_49_13]
MPKSLVIVESPAKANTISKFLGPDYTIKASMGHIKDLPLKELGVDVNNGFKPKFTTIKLKKKIVKEIVDAAKKADMIYIATDPDREGEAIAHHLALEVSPGNKTIDTERIKRVTFHEITKEAVNAAFLHPGPIDTHKVEAQQARRILDRLVGYKLSPLLWRKIRGGLSAGRVQSVALRIICEREKLAGKFKPEEYWLITAKVESPSAPPPFIARLEKIKNEKLKIKNGEEANNIVAGLKGARFIVSDVLKEDKRKFPLPPFTTSTMQQESVKNLGMSASKTMRVAQALYEGISVGEEGPVGLITYMRTDSVKIAQEAQNSAIRYIREKYGELSLPSKPPVYKSNKRAQEAHEAIRPTGLSRDPEKIKKYLAPEQYKLYKLIWERFIASQMKYAMLELTTILIEAGDAVFKATGTIIKDKGFMAVYGYAQPDASEKKEEEEEDDSEAEEKKEQRLPAVKKGEALNVLEVLPNQKFTKPPARYTEASLVKMLEEKGIGRPSTYAPIIQTILFRRYVLKEKGKLIPTELGQLVNDMLVENFPVVIDSKFTADLENELDEVEEGKTEWTKVVNDLYVPFEETLKKAQNNIEKMKRKAEPTGKICPECGSPVVEREGRFGSFLACSAYPKCKYTKSATLNIPCPAPGCTGEVVQRRTKKGRTFYGCSRYPQCNYMSWQKPAGKDNVSTSQRVNVSESKTDPTAPDAPDSAKTTEPEKDNLTSEPANQQTSEPKK